jgi:hypothetical protein
VNNTTNIKDSIEQREKQAGIQLPVDLRDYFAAKAMQSDMTGGIHADDFDWSAKRAYLMADVMMKARRE